MSFRYFRQPTSSRGPNYQRVFKQKFNILISLHYARFWVNLKNIWINFCLPTSLWDFCLAKILRGYHKVLKKKNRKKYLPFYKLWHRLKKLDEILQKFPAPDVFPRFCPTDVFPRIFCRLFKKKCETHVFHFTQFPQVWFILKKSSRDFRLPKSFRYFRLPKIFQKPSDIFSWKCDKKIFHIIQYLRVWVNLKKRRY